MTITPEIFAGLNTIEAMERIIMARLGLLATSGLSNDPIYLRLKTRQHHIMLTRQVCIYFLHYYKLLPNHKTIAARYNLDHSTVSHARRVVKNAFEGCDPLLPKDQLNNIQTILDNLGYGYKQST